MTLKNTLSPSLLRAAEREAKLVLAELVGIKAVVIASVDGFDVASASTDNVDPVRIAAMASSIAAIGSVVAHEAALGAPTNIMINSTMGFVQVFNVDRPDVQLIVNIVSDSSGVLAQVAYRGRLMAKSLQSA